MPNRPLYTVGLNELSVVNRAIAQYQKLDVQSRVAGSSPHELIDMLFEGALSRLKKAQGCLARQDLEGRTKAVNDTVSILSGLEASLDHEKGGELADNLAALYDYMQRRLFRATADNDHQGLEEVVDLIRTLHQAWQAIAPEVAVAEQGV